LQDTATEKVFKVDTDYWLYWSQRWRASIFCSDHAAL